VLVYCLYPIYTVFLHSAIKQESRADTAFGPKCIRYWPEFLGEVRGAFQSFYNTVVLDSPCEFAKDRQLLSESRVDSQHPNRFVRIFSSVFQAFMFSIDEVIRLRKR
jgi:hypothetical protein